MRFLQAWAVWPRFSEVLPKLYFGLNFYEKMFVTPEQHWWHAVWSYPARHSQRGMLWGAFEVDFIN